MDRYADMERALDIPERQVLLYFSGDPVPWHHRILMERISGSKWIVATPTLDIEIVDLAEAEDVRPLERFGEMPALCRPLFSFEVIERGELDQVRWRCRSYADVLGVPPPVAVGLGDAEWLFADPSHEKFGEAVPGVLLAGGHALVRGSMALVQEDAFNPDVFAFAESVRREDRERWSADKRAGAGRDPRLNAGFSSDGRRVLLSEALGTMKAIEKRSWAFKGPPAVKEVLEGIKATGLEPPAYVTHYLGSSGIGPHSGLAQEFKHLMTILWMMVCFDRLDVLNVSSAEYVARRVLMIQRAVKRNPRSPDFDGLECFMPNALDVQGGIVTSEFEKHMSELQRSEAQIMKQQRLAREETEALETKKKKDKGKGGGKGSGDAAPGT